MSNRVQQYCLRWNNHRLNLLTVFDELLHNEAFTDVTLVCDIGTSIKCHKVVLAACSTYFQNLFTDLKCSHPVVVLKDVKYDEIKAILEYMYRGEVNVAQDQLAALLKVAETLKVKGLVQEKQLSPENQYSSGGSCDTGVHNSSNADDDLSAANSPNSLNHTPISLPPNTHMINSGASIGPRESPPLSAYPNTTHYGEIYSKSGIAHSLYSNKGQNNSNKYSNYHSGHSQQQHHHHQQQQQQQQQGQMLSSSLYSNYNMNSTDNNSSLKKKKLSNMIVNRDTPILRTALGLGQGQAQNQSPNRIDSSQPVSLVCHSNNRDNDEDIKEIVKTEPNEDAQSPYTTDMFIDEDDKSRLIIPSSSPQTFLQDSKNLVSGIASYVPTQKPEWKRYKQYTRQDINSAIDAVKNGMSALQAARRYGVPSRTLYDKVKKQGITTSRPFRRANNSNGNGGTGIGIGTGLNTAGLTNNQVFPYGVSGLKEMSEMDDSGNRSISAFDATILQHAFNRSMSTSNDINENNNTTDSANIKREESLNLSQNSPRYNNTSNSSQVTIPTTSLIKFMRQINLVPPDHPEENLNSDRSVANKDNNNSDENGSDQVEDLSIGKKTAPISPQIEAPIPSSQQFTFALQSIPVSQPQSIEQTERAVTPVTPQPQSPLQQPSQQQQQTTGVIISPLQMLKKEICVENQTE